MKEMQTTYNPKDFEERIYAEWMKKDCFRAEIDPHKVPFTVMMPPPNVTGQLHMGHAMDETMQDILVRFKRMQGYSALWLPGVDHAALATEVKVVEQIRKEGLTKEGLGREKFLQRVWEWKEKYGGRIVEQLKKLGSSCDWSRLAFTMDEKCSLAVREAFFRLYQRGLVYRGSRIINWCPGCKTALSDVEVDYSEDAGHFWYFKYPVEGSDLFITIATTRPETMLGDTAVAVNPNDERYSHLVGKTLLLPLTSRKIPLIADEYVEPEFGTGAVKITPAHDPNDFEVGLRHNLPLIRVMNDDGTMNELTGDYAGLDRYEARKQIVSKMESLGLLVKIQPHVHNVGHCSRCRATLEPIVSKQWFVKMQPLAKPAIDAVMKNKTKFTPDRFSKIYYNWLENIRDWCISRQLWWGHRIPVWYCEDCGEEICSVDTPSVCPKCGSVCLKQDEDVLDTWFSSALWPFSTLGWPNNTPDFNYFYPTDVLVTGYDIIPFWVMRMMFSGIEYTEKVPFRDVLIHGLVRDEQGRKMSKSLGNGIDPLEIIEKYGADSLRLSLVTGVAPGNDTRFTDTKVEASRNFINKVWNAARFVVMNAQGADVPEISEIRLQPADRWIISRLQLCIREVTVSLQKYDLGIAADKLIDFTWNDFCDWYIELSKPALYGEDKEKKRATLGVLLFVLENILKLLHPFIPFATEEIYSYLPNAKGNIITSEYPRYNTKLSYKKEAKAFEGIIDLIKTVRAMKVDVNCPPSKKVHLYLVSEAHRLITVNKNSIQRLAGASEIEFLENGSSLQKTVSKVCELGQIFVPLGELVDLDEERIRLNKELDRIKNEIARADGKLLNKNFVAKAPKKLVEDERAKKEKYLDMKEKIEKQLKALL
ncbi:MAG: valine--tRNA ligase [Clostridia bacterium]|jgi:valyl-tRNA synthetase|nr:valine--tRNA ligase [Clostridia bacterium]